MKQLPSEYYIEEDFAILAGPYDPKNMRDTRFKNQVIKDLNRGNIPWRIYVDEAAGYEYIERKGMILPKRNT
jgi:hypothetical protein